MSEVVVSPLADQVPGIKHKNPVILGFLAGLIRQTPHDQFVDPFAGSGTFALNSTAPYKNLNVPCELLDGILDIDFEGDSDIRCDDDWQAFLSYVEEEENQPSDSSLLFLDPPRPRARGDFGPYDREFTPNDWAALQDAAVSWPGPVILASYHHDLYGGSAWNHVDENGSWSTCKNVNGSDDLLMILWWGGGWHV